MALNSMQEIFEKAASRSIPFWRVVLETDMEERQVTEEQSMEKMRAAWHAMLESAVSYQGDQRSRSGLVGGDGAQMRRYAAADTTYSGPYVQEVIATALSVGESNACMRKIVAAPTAGACGVLPAVLVPLYQMGRATEEEILQALYTASGIGAVVSFRACIAGASGGCQAEIGTASAMAAGALTSLRGGDPQQIGHAAAMALKNLMGLVCDPVAGLVEVPCVKRNVAGAMNARAEEVLSAYRAVAAYNCAGRECEAFAARAEELCAVSIRAESLSNGVGPVLDCIANIGFVAVAVAGGFFALRGEITIGVISAFLIYAKQFTRPVNEVAQLYGTLQTAVAGAERVFDQCFHCS